MPVWTWEGLKRGKATTAWPKDPQADQGQNGVLGMPAFNPNLCQKGCNICVEACLPRAITRPHAGLPVELDLNKCITCQLCTEVCPTGAFTPSLEMPLATLTPLPVLRTTFPHKGGREQSGFTPPLVGEVDACNAAGEGADKAPSRSFKHSLHIRHVDAGSCNGCESELQALLNPFYDLERLGIFFTPSPRKADLLLVTGPVTQAMHAPLLAAYEAMAKPRWVMAMGTCAVSGGVARGGVCYEGVKGILPVDIELPSCPPNPAALIAAFQLFLKKKVGEYQGVNHVTP